MKERKHDSPNFFPRLPFTILAIAGIVILAANAVLTYTLEEYPLFIGIGMFTAYSLATVIIIAVQTSKYKFINNVNEKTAAFNTEIINMFKYITDIPYAIINKDGNAVIVNNALQKLIGEEERPIFNRPLTDFCSPARFTKDALGEFYNEFGNTATFSEKSVFDIIKGSVDKKGTPLVEGREAGDMSCFWSYKLEPTGGMLMINDRHYTPRACEIMVQGEKYYFTVFTDVEDILEYRDRMSGNNTVVAYIVPDNLQQIGQAMQSGYRDAAAKLEATLRKFAKSIDGFLREYDRDKYMLVFTREKLNECRDTNYRILSDVRAINLGDIASDGRPSDAVLTISIGIADINDTMSRKEESAKDALELAIRRGGDQVVTHTSGETEYYGGQIKENAGNTIIDTKSAAQQVWHHISNSDSVYIMGHSFPDFDSIASCIGLARVAYDILSKRAGDRAYNDVYREESSSRIRTDGLEALRDRAATARKIAEMSVKNQIKIIIDRSNANFTQFYDMLMRTSTPEDKDFYKKLFVGRNAANSMPSNSLLILTDVSNYSIAESKDAIEIADKVIIVDHHRSGEFTKEPNYKFIKSGASSASEIIASMIEHGNFDISLTRSEATLMLAGIMLDTNKFSRNTTDLTFAAAQYLIRCGADQDEARQFFLDKYSVYQCESKILGSDIDIYKGIAITKLDLGREMTGDDRVAASKAADRLITIKGIDAAFTLTKAGDNINISARSNGKINVQRLAEKLGGGGHFNMAGALIKEKTLESVSETLKKHIDEYFDAKAAEEKTKKG